MNYLLLLEPRNRLFFDAQISESFLNFQKSPKNLGANLGAISRENVLFGVNFCILGRLNSILRKKKNGSTVRNTRVLAVSSKLLKMRHGGIELPCIPSQPLISSHS